MSQTSRFLTRHVLAYIASLVALSAAWLGTSLITGATDWAEEPISCWFWCFRTHLTLACVLLPLFIVAELVLVRPLRLSWWVHLPAIGASLFVASVVSTQLMVLLLTGEFVASGSWEEHVVALGVLGAQDVVWGGAYWTILRATDIVLPPTVHS
jgi:hypothetical protein